MQGEREQMRGTAQEARGTMTEVRGRAMRLMGSTRRTMGETMSRYGGRSTAGIIGGMAAFFLAASAAMIAFSPGARMRLQGEIGRYTGRTRPERPIDRIRRWSRDGAAALGFGRY